MGINLGRSKIIPPEKSKRKTLPLRQDVEHERLGPHRRRAGESAVLDPMVDLSAMPDGGTLVLEQCYMECTTGNHNKFYFMRVIRRPGFSISLEKTYGRIGTVQSRTNLNFSTPFDATREMRKIQQQKIGKGYITLQLVPSYLRTVVA